MKRFKYTLKPLSQNTRDSIEFLKENKSTSKINSVKLCRILHDTKEPSNHTVTIKLDQELFPLIKLIRNNEKL